MLHVEVELWMEKMEWDACKVQVVRRGLDVECDARCVLASEQMGQGDATKVRVNG